MAADLAEMGSLSSQNKVVKYLCVTNFFTKYAWGKPSKGKIVLVAFMEIGNESNHKSNYGSFKA